MTQPSLKRIWAENSSIMQIFSHRGFHQNIPENTMAAFEAAIALGVDGIETDIRVTRDGVPILYHNSYAPDETEVAALTQEQLSQVARYSVPRLEEALTAFGGQVNECFCWNLELKTRDSFSLVLETLERLKPTTNILLTSFWHDGIVAIAPQSPYPLGLIWASHPYDLEYAQCFDRYPGINTMVFYQERLSFELVRACQQKGLRVYGYGDRTPQDQEKLKTWSIDALITDNLHCALQ